MEIVLCVCCETCVQDIRTNVASLFNVIEEISVAAFPVALAKLTTLVMATKNPEEPKSIPAKLRLTLNETTKIFETNISFEFQDKQRTKSIAEMQGVPILASGTLRLQILNMEDREIAGWSIAVAQIGPPQMTLFNVPQMTPTGPAAPAGQAPPAG